jgi:hypothetical protein
MNELKTKTDNYLMICFAMIIFLLCLFLLITIQPYFMSSILLTVILRIIVLGVFGNYRIKSCSQLFGKEVVKLSIIFVFLVLHDVFTKLFFSTNFPSLAFEFSGFHKSVVIVFTDVILMSILLYFLYRLNTKKLILTTLILGLFFFGIIPIIDFIFCVFMLGKSL